MHIKKRYMPKYKIKLKALHIFSLIMTSYYFFNANNFFFFLNGK